MMPAYRISYGELLMDRRPSGDKREMRGRVRVVVWIFGSVLAIILTLVTALAVDWGISQSRAERDRIILQRTSLDGKRIAEIHTFTTARWGGPDRLYVSIREISGSFGAKVYEQAYECDDTSAFGVRWQTPSQLQVRVGKCNSNPSLDIHSLDRQNKVLEEQPRSGPVTIDYVDANYVASR
jgi:hypothetical protein